MITMTTAYTTESIPVGETQLYLLKGGEGRACLALHGIEGHEGWLAFHDALAPRATVYAPSHPGYGHTDWPDWITSVRHQAVFYNWFLQDAGLHDVDLLGIGLGGWIAAEMAIMDTSRLRHLVLVAATGIRPERSELLDIFVVPWRHVIERGFLNSQRSPEYQRIYGAAPIQEFGGIREFGRTMSMRMCFRPYMYDPSLPGMLGKVDVPSLVVWGEDDEIVPVEVGHLYQRAIPGSVLKTIPQCGHFAHLDQPQQLARIVQEFFASEAGGSRIPPGPSTLRRSTSETP
jgi:pimeloyl-ACP methyl ester carboxylesterase